MGESCLTLIMTHTEYIDRKIDAQGGFVCESKNNHVCETNDDRAR